MTNLLDTRKEFDAGVCGYDGPRDPRNDSEGLIVGANINGGITYVTLIGPDGTVELGGAPEIRAVIEALCVALRMKERSALVQTCFEIANAGVPK